MRSRTATALSLAALLFAAAACSHAAGAKPGKGDKVIDVPVQTLDGETKKLSDLLANRVALFKFGATWCPPCKLQMREFDKLLKHYGETVVIFDIDIREPAAKVKAYHEKNKFQTPTYLDPKGEAARRYHVEGIPTVFVVSHTGVILHRSYTIPAAKLKPVIDQALAAAEKAGKE